MFSSFTIGLVRRVKFSTFPTVQRPRFQQQIALDLISSR